MLIANLGLAEILRLSIPVLNALYPVAIVLIALSFVPGLEQRHRVYPLCIGCTAVQSIAAALPLADDELGQSSRYTMMTGRMAIATIM